MLTIPESKISWMPSYRIIADRYPAINFFERICADPNDWSFLHEVELLTSPFGNAGNINALEIEDRISGRGFGRVHPSFTFHDPLGTRFGDSSFGAYYAGIDLKTAILETVHHRTIFMSDTKQPAQDLDQLLILADISGTVHDIRNMQLTLPDIYSPSDYSLSQKLARDLRAAGSLGIVFSSVRNLGAECVAVWRPRIISKPREDRHITYRWNGKRITGFFYKSSFEAIM